MFDVTGISSASTAPVYGPAYQTQDKENLTPAAPKPVQEPAKTQAEDPDVLSDAEQATVDDLRARDAEVRAHEEAHKRVAGTLAGPIQYDYETGPDGNSYAVAGSVEIDMSAEDDPAETIAKMETVIDAALAPADPSAADRAVANAAEATKRDAEALLRAQEAAAVQEPVFDEPSSVEALPAEEAAPVEMGSALPDADPEAAPSVDLRDVEAERGYATLSLENFNASEEQFASLA